MSESIVTNIEVVKLFGRYTYALPAKGALPMAAIFYGDNGVGKSTILRLLFHSLSSASNKGHRTAIANIAFQRFALTLSNGVGLSLERDEASLAEKPFTQSISRGGKILAKWTFDPTADDEPKAIDWNALEAIRSLNIDLFATPKKEVLAYPVGEKPFLEALKETAPTIFFVSADRRLDSDTVPDPSDEVELRRQMQFEEARKIQDLVRRVREIALTQALSSATRWIQRKAIQSTNRGSTNVHTVYTNVVKHISASKATLTDNLVAPVDVPALIERLDVVETLTEELARYELAAKLTTSEFKKALRVRNQSRRTLAAGVLMPYLESVESRIDALEPIYRILNNFVTTVNGFLFDKTLRYKQTRGFELVTADGKPLAPAQLSSGEQQLILLFCYAMIARDYPSVFIIDEPEISLNVKWQRQLLRALLSITDETEIQFIVASHSMELIAQHRERVVTFENHAR